MATIKELAAYTGLSASTISIVLRGNSEKRKIPKETQLRVWEAAKVLGYQPNVTARRLRGNEDTPLIIAILWASDFRAQMMVRFLSGIQKELMESNRNYELVIYPYSNDKLCEISSLRNSNMYNAAIICNASDADMQYLESSTFHIPIVLYNRISNRYCTVNVDDMEMGAVPAKVFALRGHKNAAILTSPTVFPGMDKRVNSFIKTGEDLGLKTVHIETVSNSMSGGYEGALKIISDIIPRPDCLFCASDTIAIGALRAFLKSGISIPKDLEMISIGNGDRELEEYASTSLSVMQLPMEDMASECLKIISDILTHIPNKPYSTVLPIKYIARESCG